MDKHPAIYIMANKRHGTLYVGVTSDLAKRVYQHKNTETASFTQKHSCKNLVYFERSRRYDECDYTRKTN